MNRSLALAVAAAIAASSLYTGAALAQQSAMLPVEQRQGPVSFITGGITMDEAEAFRAAMPRYALALELAQAAQPRAEFLSGVLVSIKDSSGQELLNVVSDGPFVLAQLPPGQYSIRAESMGVVRTQSVQISSGASRHVVMM